VPSRFGPDYRKHLKLLPDLLSLSPLGLSLDDLLQGPGILERIEAIKKGILKGYAGALPRKEVHALEDGLVKIDGVLNAVHALHPAPGMIHPASCAPRSRHQTLNSLPC